MRVVAFDSKRVFRKKANKDEFTALLGVGVTISDYRSFCEKYNIILGNLFKQYNLQQQKRIYKGSDLQNIFYGLGIDAITIIVEQIIPLISYIDVYYSYFLDFEPQNSSTVSTMGIYWDQEIKRVKPLEFINLIDGCYPAICCYAHIRELSITSDTLFLIDQCSGLRPSNAIETVIRNPNTKFLFRGDQCNYAICAADLLCKYIDQSSLLNGYNLNKEIIKKIQLNLEKSKTTFIGPKWLKQIKPSKDLVLDINHKIPHPIFFFFPDNKGPFEKDSKEILEKSPLFSLALDKASILGGSLKFFEPNDLNYINKEDYLVTHNELSKNKSEELKALGCQATKIDASFFNK